MCQLEGLHFLLEGKMQVKHNRPLAPVGHVIERGIKY